MWRDILSIRGIFFYFFMWIYFLNIVLYVVLKVLEKIGLVKYLVLVLDKNGKIKWL